MLNLITSVKFYATMHIQKYRLQHLGHGFEALTLALRFVALALRLITPWYYRPYSHHCKLQYITILWLSGLCPGQPKRASTRRYISPSSGFFWSKMTIKQADAPTIWMDCHFIQTNWCPHLCHPHHFYAGLTHPYTTLPIYPGLGQAPNMLACIPGGLKAT